MSAKSRTMKVHTFHSAYDAVGRTVIGDGGDIFRTLCGLRLRADHGWNAYRAPWWVIYRDGYQEAPHCRLCRPRPQTRNEG